MQIKFLKVCLCVIFFIFSSCTQTKEKIGEQTLYILCVDKSKSMIGKREIEAKKPPKYDENVYDQYVLPIIMNIIDTKKQEDKITLLTCGEKVDLLLDKENDTEKILNTLKNIDINAESTDLNELHVELTKYYGALRQSDFNATKKYDVVALLFSDGVDTQHDPNSFAFDSSQSSDDVQCMFFLNLD